MNTPLPVSKNFFKGVAYGLAWMAILAFVVLTYLDVTS